MPTKDILLEKICRKPAPANFTVRELDALMKKCGCEKFQGGRGSGIGYFHTASKRILQFDGPHDERVNATAVCLKVQASASCSLTARTPERNFIGIRSRKSLRS